MKLHWTFERRGLGVEVVLGQSGKRDLKLTEASYPVPPKNLRIRSAISGWDKQAANVNLIPLIGRVGY